MQKDFLVMVGTRPEAIKLFPVINRLKTETSATVKVCATAQHRQMLDQVLKLTNIVPDIDLDVMRANQTLDQLTARLLQNVGEVLDRVRPSRVIVQGDTTTAMASALAAYYRRIPVSHVEAGLRSGDIYAPWPEEVNRKIIGTIADQHFAPTARAADALRAENVPDGRIHVTGNTVVDALLAARKIVDSDPRLASRWNSIRLAHHNRRIILVTCHRRENFGAGILGIADALQTIVQREDVAIVLPLHPNPNVADVLSERLSGHPRVELITPQDYTDFVGLLSLAYVVLTDSRRRPGGGADVRQAGPGDARDHRAARRRRGGNGAPGRRRPRQDRGGDLSPPRRRRPLFGDVEGPQSLRRWPCQRTNCEGTAQCMRSTRLPSSASAISASPPPP